MKIKNNYSNKNINNAFNNKKNNIKVYYEYYSSKNEPMIISPEKKIKKNKIKPPFKQGLYSYKQSYKTLQNDSNKNILNNNFFSNDYQNNNNINNNNNVLNLNTNVYTGWAIPHMTNNNSSLSFTSINLNKYKINISPNQKPKNFMNNTNNNNNNVYNSNNNINNKNNGNNNINNINNNNVSSNNTISKVNNNYNSVKNTNMSLNINLHNLKNNNKLNNNNSNKNLSKKNYHNYFSDNKMYEKESRRMLIEYVKILNHANNNDNNENGIKQILLEKNLSQKILNQKYNDMENENNNNELFGEAKKQLYLQNLNYSISYDSSQSNNGEESSNNLNNNILNLSDLNDMLLIKDKKKINILNFLCIPRVLNLIEEDDTKDKYIFLIRLNETYYIEAKESFCFQWRNMSNNEIENEFNLKDIKSCNISKHYNNRFILEVEKEDYIENLNFEIEAPTNEICNNYVMGINYLMRLIKK